MFTADFQNYWYELAEKDYAMGVACRDNMPDQYYHAYGALYAKGEMDSANCADPDKTVTNPLSYLL